MKNDSVKIFKTDEGYTLDVSTGYIYEGGHKNDLPVLNREKDSLPPLKIYKEKSPQLQISMTDACNMDCSYCSFRARVSLDGKPVNMPLSRAKKAIDFFKREYGSDLRYGRIDFGLAGEPMLRHKTHEPLFEYIKNEFKESQAECVWVGTNTTNGSLFLKEGLPLEIAPPMDISMDGPKDVHDKLRKYTDGTGTYDDVERVAREALKKYPDIGVSAVLTAECTDFVKIFTHLRRNLGFSNIYMKPVNLSPDISYGLNPDTLDSFRAGYEGLVDYFISLPAHELLKDLLSLSNQDYFMRFFYRVKDRHYQVYRCGAGKSGAYVDTNGKLYACAHFIGKRGWDIGSLDKGFDEEKRQKFLDMHVDTREPCKSCWARYICGGGCYYQAVLTNGAIEKPDETKCSLIMHLINLSIRLLAHIVKNCPEVFSALPRPYYTSLDPSPKEDEVYVPRAVLGGVGEDSLHEEKNLADKVEGGIVSPGARVVPYFELCEGYLKIFLSLENVDIEAISLKIFDHTTASVFYRDLMDGNPDRKAQIFKTTKEEGFKTFSQRVSADEGAIKRVPYIPPKWEKCEAIAFEKKESGKIEIAIPVHMFQLEKGYNVGFNFEIDLATGGKVSLVRYEPFCSLQLAHSGKLFMTGGEFARSEISLGKAINCNPVEGLEPLTRWITVSQNVC